VNRDSWVVIRLFLFPLCSLCSLWLIALDLIGVYRRPSAAKLVLHLIRVYLRVSAADWFSFPVFPCLNGFIGGFIQLPGMMPGLSVWQ
jgi:hypothetical protein